MKSFRLYGAKVASVLLFLSLVFSPLSVFAVNPPAPFSPSDNVLDPGCLPTDSNCYVSISNLTLNQATTTSLSVLGASSIAGNLEVTGKTTLGLASSTALSVSGTSYLSNTLASSLAIAGDSSFGGNISLSGATSTVTENIVTTVVPSVRAGGHIYNDSDRQIVVSPTDGFVRFVYFDQSSWDKLYLVRCLDNNCTTSATTTLVTDSNEPEYAAITLGPDNLPHISYITYASPQELHYVQCLNESCSSNTNQIVATSTGYFYEQSLVVGSDGFARIAYEDYDTGSVTSLKLTQCADASCSSKTTITIATTTGSYLIPKIALDSNDVVHIAYTIFSLPVLLLVVFITHLVSMQSVVLKLLTQ